MAMENRGISFVLCCHNSEAVIGDCLAALQKQVNCAIPFEVILVDNNCTDGTTDIAKRAWTRRDAPLIIVAEEKPGLIHARKRGVEHARFAYVSFVDDDNFVEDRWVAKVCRIFDEKQNVGAVGSHNKPLLDGSAPAWFEAVQMNYACGRQLPHSGYVAGERKHLWGAGLSLRSAIIKEIFSSRYNLLLTGRKGEAIMSGEDAEICLVCRLMGWDLWYEDTLSLSHKIASSRLRWDYFCGLQKGFGEANLILDIYKRRLDEKPPPIYGSVLARTSRRLLRKLKKNRGIPLQPQEGKDVHRQIYYCWGMLRAALRLRGEYPSLVHAIYDKDY